jgi:hypothetical protein
MPKLSTETDPLGLRVNRPAPISSSCDFERHVLAPAESVTNPRRYQKRA